MKIFLSILVIGDDISVESVCCAILLCPAIGPEMLPEELVASDRGAAGLKHGVLASVQIAPNLGRAKSLAGGLEVLGTGAGVDAARDRPLLPVINRSMSLSRVACLGGVQGARGRQTHVPTWSVD